MTLSSSAAATTALSAPPIWRWRGSRWSYSISATWSEAPPSRKSSVLAFRNSVASYTVSLLNPKVIRDLDLHAHGLRVVERPIANFLPLDDGRFLKVGGGHTKREVAKFSMRDADRLDDYQARLTAVAEVLRAVVLETPPNVVEGTPLAAIAELIKLGRSGNRIRALGLDLQRDLLDLFTASAGDILDGWFESDVLKGLLASTASSATTPAPTRPARPMCCCTMSSAR